MPSTVAKKPKKTKAKTVKKPKYPGIPITCNGNQLVAQYVEARITEGGVFYPITPSTEGGELYQKSFANGDLNVFGQSKIAIETEGEHSAQGGATAYAVTGKRTVNFTSGQGIAYAMEQYYHAPGKFSTMVLEVGSRALTKHALNVHCGHDDVYSALDTGWTILYGRDAQQAADQAVILRKVNELTLNPGMNVQDGMLTTHAERVFLKHEAELLREFLGHPRDLIECPTPAQVELFGKTRRRVPAMINLSKPLLLGPVQNQEHHMNGIVARRNNFTKHILPILKQCYDEFGDLTGRRYGFISQYRCDDAEAVFISLGSAAENIEAACDYIREKHGKKVGSIHLNVLRPFPESVLLEALRGKKYAIVLERTDESMAGDNPLARDVRVAISKSRDARNYGGLYPVLERNEIPRLLRGVYGIGSRDFRPEHILGAFEFAAGKIARKNGKTVRDGKTFFTLGVDHPYSVISKDTPSLLPDNSIAVRFHSIGGWGMITTGKNLGAIIGEFAEYISEQDPEYDDEGNIISKIHIAANPKYGSEKKGAPTNYYLVVAPERVRVNCELNHVDVVLCCDPKAFTHTNPIAGIKKGGSLVWESHEAPEKVWQRIPQNYRKHIIANKIKIYTLPGFNIAKKATSRSDLQLRMQGNAFLGAFFRVSPFLKQNKISKELYEKTVRQQYEKKFGRFGDAVVESNMEVMTEGFAQVSKIDYGKIEVADRSSMRRTPISPVNSNFEIIPSAGFPDKINACGIKALPQQEAKKPIFTRKKFDSEFRSGLGYHQPAGALASTATMAAGTGSTSSKYVARRETPLFIPENCTQCMECITACPDTALPNTAQDISTVLGTAINNYVSNKKDKDALKKALPELDKNLRDKMLSSAKAKERIPFQDFLTEELENLNGKVSTKAKKELLEILKVVPLAYSRTPNIFQNIERKQAGEGGIFSIFVSDLCKGCAECVERCGDHGALVMVPDTPDFNKKLTSAQIFSRLLPETKEKYLGIYDNENPQDSRPAALRNHLMVRRNYEALVSGDGACAGCGEKTILRAVASITEAYMRPIFHRKANRLLGKAENLEQNAIETLTKLKAKDKKAYKLLRKLLAHIVLELGGENDKDTDKRLSDHGIVNDKDFVSALVSLMRMDAFRHKDLQTSDGRLSNGMSVMAMGANTGCNTVYGSTPPSNPHPYPWMNSLFQDGSTISWLIGESLIHTHARRSVAPERLADILLSLHEDKEVTIDKQLYFDITRLSDTGMSEGEIEELPRVWCIGGDGALGDIGYQNLSKAILQSRPNVNFLMLDTQVYSNTGGQNSDSSPMTGGFDMNQYGMASQGKLVEKKSVAETLTSGHGSPYIAQVSAANSAKLFASILEGLQYRGAAFYQCYTTCQPEHGVGDDTSNQQAKFARDSRGMPEFIFNPQNGENILDNFDIKGNPNVKNDWQKMSFDDGDDYAFTVAHWAATEARFRNHMRRVSSDEAKDLLPLENILLLITQNDVMNRKVFDKSAVCHVPDFRVGIKTEFFGKITHFAISRQMVLYCVERRKAWRLLQSKAGVENVDYQKQKKILAELAKGEKSKISRADVLAKGANLEY